MKLRKHRAIPVLSMTLCSALLLAACSGTPASGSAAASESAASFGSSAQETTQSSEIRVTAEATLPDSSAETAAEPQETTEGATASEPAYTISSDGSGILGDTSELFSNRDLTMTPDLTDATSFTLTDGEDIHITTEGTYVLSGTASGVTVYVEAADTDKVQLVLDGASITNEDFPAIYAIEADKVFVTTIGDSSLSVTGTFRADGETNTDGVIFSRCDLVLNGTAALTVSSSDNAVVCKDDLKLTGGTYALTATGKGIDVNDSVLISGGTLNITAGDDGIHADDSDDDSTGYVYIYDGDITIDAGDDGIHAVTVLQIDGGTVNVSAAEGLEATYVQLNGGTITVNSSDDGINAANKSGSYNTTLEINGGEVTVNMSGFDTDGLDSNGDLTITGGTISITGQSACDYDGTGTFTGGTLLVNGQEMTTLPNQIMGGHGGQ